MSYKPYSLLAIMAIAYFLAYLCLKQYGLITQEQIDAMDYVNKQEASIEQFEKAAPK